MLVAERFRLVRQIGKGGMGAVWLAEHTGLGSACALKVVDPKARESQEVLERFALEARVAAQLRSRHVVQIFDHGEWHGVPFIAMELLEGEDLGTRLERRALTPAETLRIASQVGRALAKAHRLGIVHRDLKPENIFLAADDEGEIAKILDFGIAKSASMRLSSTETRPGTLLGTPFYMSPEQARGAADVDSRSDLWSLGTIVFECVTGQMAFRGDGVGEVLGKIMYEPLPPAVGPGVPEGFQRWWERASQRDRALRFQSIEELLDALVVALELSEPVRLPLASRVDSEPIEPRAAREQAPTVADVTTRRAVALTVAGAPQGRSRAVVVAAIGAGVAAVAIAGALLLAGGGGAAPPSPAGVGSSGHTPAPPAAPLQAEPPAPRAPVVAPSVGSEAPAGPASASAAPSASPPPARRAAPPRTTSPRGGGKPGQVDFGI
ncbi:MAG: serine/threonine protein kinase [Polyangiaceae bacterium]|nr:serine/threonine protein kinase [Polyangiaceae bacterium]